MWNLEYLVNISIFTIPRSWLLLTRSFQQKRLHVRGLTGLLCSDMKIALLS